LSIFLNRFFLHTWLYFMYVGQNRQFFLQSFGETFQNIYVQTPAAVGLNCQLSKNAALGTYILSLLQFNFRWKPNTYEVLLSLWRKVATPTSKMPR
jgi:hypothetical protein